MFKFIKSKQIVLFLASLIMSSSLLFSSVSLSDDMNYPGSICMPANLAQAVARGMSWNQFRSFNPSETQDFFVTCPLPKSDTEGATWATGFIVHHFDTGYDSTDSVQCLWRQNFEAVTQLNVATSVVTLAKDTNTTDLLPTTAFNGSVALDDNFTLLGNNNYYMTLTCKLPPKTGINGIVIFD